MEIRAEQGQGKYVVAGRRIREGELVFVSRALLALPNIGKIVAGTWCAGCAGKIPKAEQRQHLCVAGDGSGGGGGCCAAFCSAECRSMFLNSHRRICPVLRAFGGSGGKTNADDCDLVVLAALIALALQEGYELPSGGAAPKMQQQQQQQQQKKKQDAPPVLEGAAAAAASADRQRAAAEALAKDIAFVLSAPRDSIAVLYPEMMAKQKQKQQQQQQQQKSAADVCAAAAASAVSSSSSSSADAVVAVTSIRQRDAAERDAALCAAASPTMADFFDNVSNAAAMSLQPDQIERIAKMHNRYRTVAAKAVAVFDAAAATTAVAAATAAVPSSEPSAAAVETGKAAAAPALSSSVASLHFSPKISWSFFLHLYSTLASNCFGIYDVHTAANAASSEPTGVAVFPSASYFNHSCDPSLMRRQERDTIAFYARRDIAPGECLAIDYGSLHEKWPADVESRRDYLLRMYRFWCGCGLCVAQSNVLAKTKRGEAVAPEELAAATMSPPTSKACEKCSFGAARRRVFSSDGKPAAEECRYCHDFVGGS